MPVLLAKIDSDMSIHEWPGEIKSFASAAAEKIKALYTLILLVVIAILFFILGRLSALEEVHTPIKILAPASQTGSAIQASAQVNKKDAKTEVTTSIQPLDTSLDGEVIGSKTGKKYYFPWCGTVKRVKPENQVVFKSISDARAAGYLPGGNCKGLK